MMARVNYTSADLEKRGFKIVKKKSHLMTVDDAMRLYEETGTIVFESPDTKHYVFPVTPIPAPRMTQGQMKLVHIHDLALNKDQIAIKKRIIRYQQYKEALSLLASKYRFKMPHSGFQITFYLPHRLDTEEINETPHQQKPDMDNMLKAFKDALCSKDQAIWDYRVTKRWCRGKENGRIEVTLIP